MKRIVYLLELEDGFVVFGQCWDTEYNMRLTQLKGTLGLKHITCLGIVSTEYSKECCQAIRVEYQPFIVAENIMKPPSLQDALVIMSRYEGMKRCEPRDQVWRKQ
ncbi:hypothetical protein VPHD260_0185 [Vibrio phage D260]